MEKLKLEHLVALKSMKDDYDQNLQDIETKRDEENQKNKENLEVTINALQTELQEIQD